MNVPHEYNFSNPEMVMLHQLAALNEAAEASGDPRINQIIEQMKLGQLQVIKKSVVRNIKNQGVNQKSANLVGKKIRPEKMTIKKMQKWIKEGRFALNKKDHFEIDSSLKNHLAADAKINIYDEKGTLVAENVTVKAFDSNHFLFLSNAISAYFTRVREERAEKEAIKEAQGQNASNQNIPVIKIPHLHDDGDASKGSPMSRYLRERAAEMDKSARSEEEKMVQMNNAELNKIEREDQIYAEKKTDFKKEKDVRFNTKEQINWDRQIERVKNASPPRVVKFPHKKNPSKAN